MMKDWRVIYKNCNHIPPHPYLLALASLTPEQVKELGQYCDGVIVGSKIVELLAAGKREEIAELIHASKATSGLSEVGQ